MKEYVYNLTADETVAIANLCNAMKGEGKHKALRSKLVNEVIKIWPEYGPPEVGEDPVERPKPETKRKITIKSKWLRAFSIGLLEIINNKDTNGASVAVYFRMAKLLRIANWIEKQMPVDSVEDFDEEMDDAPSEIVLDEDSKLEPIK